MQNGILKSMIAFKGSIYTELELSNATYVYNVKNDEWTYGPKLRTSRHSHSAGILYDNVNHDQYTVVVGGVSHTYMEGDEITSSVDEGIY